MTEDADAVVGDVEWLRNARLLGLDASDDAPGFIDTDTSASVPEGYEVVSHCKAGRIDLASPDALSTSVVHNAAVLDFLLCYPHLIPEEWKKVHDVSFWGTKYQPKGEDLRNFVRTLKWRDGEWRTDVVWLFGGWSLKNVLDFEVPLESHLGCKPDDEHAPANRARGQIDLERSNLALVYLPQQREGAINGYQLQRQLGSYEGELLGAQAIDFLMANQHLIPPTWTDVDEVFFWGTSYRDPAGELQVRYMFHKNGVWSHGMRSLRNFWRLGNPAVVRLK